MPYLPELSEGEVSRQAIEIFGGYNHNLRINEGEWYDEMNLTSARYPMFSQRGGRSTYKDGLRSPQGILAKDALAYVDGDTLYYNDYPVAGITLSTAAKDCPKQLVSMGAYLCVFPDAVYVNTARLSDCGHMGADFTSMTGATITYTLCRADGTAYTGATVSATEPAAPTNGMYWVDTSGDVHVLKQYSASTSAWMQVPTVYTRIQVANIGKQFGKYDGVTISGATCDTAGDVKAQVEALNGSAIIHDRGDNHIVIVGIVDQACEQTTGSIRVQRIIPQMDYVCEANNRLWGCYYGMRDGKALNEIYSCKQGDFKNWNCFMGISTDSYTASVGTDGEFTGCIAYLGYPLFFKENCIHKMYGTQPSSFQLQTTSCRGVQRGSWRSLAVVNELLYYKSRSDICVYDGSLPTGISEQFGTELYYDASAGSGGGRYYVSMRGADNAWHMFVYDTTRGVWHHEDNTHATGFAAWDDSLYYIDAGANRIMDANGVSGTPEGVVEWSAESGLIGYELVDQKYISRFNIRMRLGAGASCALYIEYDSDGVWEPQGVISGAGTNSFMIPVIPRRCDHFRLKLAGSGDIKIYSMAKLIERGSDA